MILWEKNLLPRLIGIVFLFAPLFTLAGVTPDLSIGYTWNSISVSEGKTYDFPLGIANRKTSSYSWSGGSAYGQLYKGVLNDGIMIGGHFLGNSGQGAANDDYFPQEGDYFVIVFNVPVWADAQWLGQVEEWFKRGTTVNPSAHPPLNWGIINFKVGEEGVELYTQIASNFPVRLPQDDWSGRTYANGMANTQGNCGLTIGSCGCALTSAVMVSRFHGATTTSHGSMDPLALNEWLQNNNGYASGGRILWDKVAKYADYKVRFDGATADDALTKNNTALLDERLADSQPAIARTDRKPGHFFVIDRKLASTYRVRDPRWYNTQTLDDPVGAPGAIDYIGQVRDYENNFDALRFYKPHNGVAYSSMTIALGSPAELLITDSEGHRLGKDPATGQEYDEIPNASYTSDYLVNPDDPNADPPAHRGKMAHFVDLPSGNYVVEVRGTGEGTYTLETTFTDTNGNSNAKTTTGEISAGSTVTYEAAFDPSNAADSSIEIERSDTTPPTITIVHPEAKAYTLRQIVTTDYFCEDDSVSVSCTGSVASGAPIDTSTLGTKTFEVGAKDRAGNTAQRAVAYTVSAYVFGGFGPSLTVSKTDLKKAKTIPVKFKLLDVDGGVIQGAIARLSVNGALAQSTGGANNSETFRFDTAQGQYVYNLAPRMLVVGRNTLVVSLDDGSEHQWIVTVQ